VKGYDIRIYVIILTEWWKTTPVSDVDIPDISRAKIVNITKSIPLNGTVVQVRPKNVYIAAE